LFVVTNPESPSWWRKIVFELCIAPYNVIMTLLMQRLYEMSECDINLLPIYIYFSLIACKCSRPKGGLKCVSSGIFDNWDGLRTTGGGNIERGDGNRGHYKYYMG
jgi:hypothetical protein